MSGCARCRRARLQQPRQLAIAVRDVAVASEESVDDPAEREERAVDVRRLGETAGAAASEVFGAGEVGKVELARLRLPRDLIALCERADEDGGERLELAFMPVAATFRATSPRRRSALTSARLCTSSSVASPSHSPSWPYAAVAGRLRHAQPRRARAATAPQGAAAAGGKSACSALVGVAAAQGT